MGKSKMQKGIGYFRLLLPLLVLFCANAQAAPGSSDWSADEKAIAQTDNDFYSATVARGGAAWGEFADDTARLPDMKSKAEIVATFTKIYAAPGYKLIWHPIYAHVFGDVGITSGSYESHITGKTGEDIAKTGTYVTVWNRQKDGSWRFVWDGGTQAK